MGKAILKVAPEMIAQFFHAHGKVAFLDARVVNYPRPTFEFMVESDDLPVAPEGADLPEASLYICRGKNGPEFDRICLAGS